MAAKALPSPDELRKLLNYDPETGVLTWKPRPVSMFADARAWKIWTARYAGVEAGNRDASGYVKIRLSGQSIYAHRAAWAIHYGEWPGGPIDHADGDRSGNRLSNIRVVNATENQRNTKRHRRNTSGVTGVHWCAAAKTWRAHIGSGGRNVHLGSFSDFCSAVAARKAAEIDLGYSPNHGRTA